MENEKRANIKPELLGGFRDYLPDVMISRQQIISKIRDSFERFGFLPLETPGLERSSVLGTDKDEFKMEVYRFKDNYQGEGQDVTLRFDLTVPLSRVIAAYPELLKPFKRYQFGNVWRKERPQSGRFREFAQFDADIVGSESILADTEILTLMYETLRNLGLENFIIRFNNRKILNGLPEIANFCQERVVDVLRVLDKLDKIGIKKVIEELQRKPANQYDDTALNLGDFSVSKIKEFLSLSDNYIDEGELIIKLKNFFRGVQIAEEGIQECESIIKNIRELGIPSRNWKFDLSIARGLGYYTGPVFETTLTDLPQIGSVFSGGRFDKLIMRFTGEKIPAVGASIGVDRLIVALEKLEMVSRQKSTARVLITLMDEKFSIDILKLAQKLRAAGINTEIYLGKGNTLKDQIIYAAKREIPFVVFFSENEKKAGKFKLKDMSCRKECLLTERELIDKLL